MIIVNLLPRVAKVCVNVTDPARQCVVEELHIDPHESEVTRIVLTDETDGQPHGLSRRTAVPLCDTLLTILETKSTQTLGTPRFDTADGAVCRWLKTLSEPVEILLEYRAVQLLHEQLPGSNQPITLTVKTAPCSASVLQSNRHWFDAALSA